MTNTRKEMRTKMINAIKNLPEVSFIDGKTLDDVQSEMVADYEAKYKEVTGRTLTLRRADPETLKLYAVSVQIFQILMHIDMAGKMDLLKYAYGDFLDNLGALRGVTRLPAYPAKATVRFTLSAVQTSAVTIPQGTRVSNGDILYFATDDVAEIAIGSTYVDVPCTCLDDGEVGNGQIAGVLNTLVDPIAYIGSVANTEETTGGSEIESDEDFADRIYLAPGSYSVAGPTDAYIYHTKSYSSSIGDVEVSSPDACEVEVRFLMADNSMPTAGIISEVQEYLSADDKRPLTDQLTVLAPTGQNFNIDVTYYINKSDTDKAVSIQAAVNAAVAEYIAWQTGTIGKDINPSVLTQMMVAAGAKRVNVVSPAFTTVPTGSVARINTQTVTYGGLEDD
jgi:phage-related baseplate assembly protein